VLEHRRGSWPTCPTGTEKGTGVSLPNGTQPAAHAAMTDTQMTAWLADAVHIAMCCDPDADPTCQKVTAALLPVMREAAALLAAEKVAAVAAEMAWPNSQNCGPELLARAAALRAGAGQ
jgi:hypothetical protein